jgi:hypothetical protein
MIHLLALLAQFLFRHDGGRRVDLGRPVRPLPPPPAVDDVEGWDRLREKHQRTYVERLTR